MNKITCIDESGIKYEVPESTSCGTEIVFSWPYGTTRIVTIVTGDGWRSDGCWNLAKGDSVTLKLSMRARIIAHGDVISKV